MNPIEEMARYCYGYGRWDAPYWFIGLEEGMDGLLQKRIDVWLTLGRKTGLSDCRAFHEAIGVTKWHHKAALQSTWRPLILLLMAFLQKDEKTESLRIYQVDRWGMANGETCLIELFGLPGKDLQAGAAQRGEHFTVAEIEDIRRKRVAFIAEELRCRKPKLVVMYGLQGKDYFKDIAGCTLLTDEVVRPGPTAMLLTRHPTFPGLSNEHWKTLGNKLREASMR